MFRSELSIPVHRDHRTFEERRHDLLNNLEKTFGQQAVSSSSINTTTSSSSTSSTKRNEGGGALVAQKCISDDWSKDVNQWIQESRAKWDDDMRRLKQEFFNLESSDNFMSSAFGDNWPTSRLGGGFNDFDSLMDGGRQSSTTSASSMSTRQYQSSLFNSNSSNLGGGGLFDMDAPFGQSLTSTNKNQLASSFGDHNKTTNLASKNTFDLSKDLYELGEDGQLHFKVRFDADGFNPEDIRVTTEGRRLTVKAKAERKTETSSSYKEFSRTIDLPDRINHDQFQCHLTKDGVLVIDAPVKAPDYKAISFSHDGGLGIKASTQNANNLQLACTGQSGPVILSGADGQKKIHVELSVETIYRPSDIHVRAEGHQIFVEGRHEESSGGRSSMRQFSKYYEVPEALDPLSVNAVLMDGVLVVEAPLRM